VGRYERAGSERSELAALGEALAGARNRIAVRIGRGEPEHCVDALDQPLRDRVLEDLRVGVHLAPVHPHHLDEEELDETVAPHDVRGELEPGLGQPNPRVGLVGDEPGPGQSLDHRGGGSRGHPEGLGDLSRRHPLAGILGLLEEDALEVVLDGARRHGARISETCFFAST